MYPSQQNATDHTANFFWLLVIIMLGMLLLWWLEKAYVVKTIFYIRHYELIFIQAVVDGINTISKWLFLPKINSNTLRYFQHFIETSDPKEIVFSQITALSDHVGFWLRYPVMVILLGLGIFMLCNNKASRFRHHYTMQTLKKLEVENWPQITPVLAGHLLKKELDEGPWAMAQLPIDFCKKNQLLELADSPEGKKIWVVKAGQAERLFVLQLGPLWQGTDALPIHVKALLVIFAARAHRDYAVADNLILQISRSADKTVLDFSGVEALLEKYKNYKVVKWLEKRHAYVGTLMASLLEIARVEGVLATAEFLWLKPVDRRLWYMLNSVGRRTAVIEIAGLFSHWLAEKRLRRSLRTPMVDAAVVALKTDIQDILYIDDEERWHTSLAA